MTETPAGAGAQVEPVPEAQKPASATTLDLMTAKLTDAGRVRPHNEDYVDYHIPADPQQLARKGSLFLVADGMGGHQAGEVASRGAVEIATAQYYSDTGHDVPTSLVRAFRTANQELHAQAQGDPSKGGMGTTLVAAVILGQKVYVANVGDSRAYLISDRGIIQITEDHSWVGEQLRAGLLTEEQARRHPQRNLVTRALGSKPAVEVDLFEGEIDPGSSILLCTDGLTGRVEDGEIAAAVQQYAPQEACRRLVALANERGGNDNITVLIVTADEALPTIKAPVLAAAGKSRGRALILGLLAVILLGLAIGAYLGAPWLLEPPSTSTPAEGMVTALPSPETVLPVATATAEGPTATPSSEPGPTSTLAPQPTQTALPPTEQTPPAPTDTATVPTATLTPGSNIPPPTLVQPQEGASVQGTVTFTWDYSLEELNASHAFQVLIWSGDPNETDPPGAAEFTRALSQEINLDIVLPAQGGPGQYFWTVAVVDTSSGNRLSRQASPRTLVYLGPKETPASSSAYRPPRPGLQLPVAAAAGIPAGQQSLESRQGIAALGGGDGSSW
ncbi:MAG: Stp1/IreP family PP2C-type Ser/Thr phosphatase [Anaerolineae bacterium]